MGRRRDDPESLAGCLADGRSINWENALRSASDDGERRILRQLRLVEGVARVHRDSASLVAPRGATPPPTPVPLGGTWGSLELREKLGEGGFGEVYRARDPRLDREVALKLLKPGSVSGAAAATQALEEGRLLAKLRHPNVVTVHGAEVHDGRVGFWMELIRGRSLAQLLRDQGPFGAREAALVGIDLCRALAAVHQAGVIHRDVKAENAMREEGGRILLTDFGAGIEAAVAREGSGRTISGTPFYMASELLRGEPASVRSDIYSLGVVLYRLVTGIFPIEASSLKELRDRHARREARLLRDQRPSLPEAFVAVIERATAWDAQARFASAGEMERALARALGTAVDAPGQPDAASAPNAVRGRWRPQLLAAAGVMVAGAAVAALFMARRVGSPPFLTDTGAPPSAGRQQGEPAATGSPVAVPAPASYTVEAALFRVSPASGVRQRLEPGDRLTLGDRLSLEFKASQPLHVYIINEDEAGHAYALFPLPGFDQQNPLAPNVAHVLPGARQGTDLSWTVDSAGGREHLLVLASPARLTEFETEMGSLARPGETAVSIPAAMAVHLRGLGGLAPTPPPGGQAAAGRLFEMAHLLAARSEVVSGVWLRRIELENPAPR